MNHSVFKKLMAVLLALVMCLGLLPAGAMAVKGQEPAHSKNVTKNDDGTYTIALDVTGDSGKTYTRANVVVVLDSSGSMEEATGHSQVTYTETTDDWDFRQQWGDYNGEKVPLHREWSRDDYSWTYYYPWNGNVDNSTLYTGTRYTRVEANQTRMQAAQDAVKGLGNSLLSLNGADGAPDDLIEIALVDFDTTATAYGVRTKYSDFEADVSETRAAGGTNWEAALSAAKNVNFGTEDNDTTYIIFVSDGNPTFRVSPNGYTQDYYQNNVYGTGKEQTQNINRCYDTAKAVADTITEPDSGYVLYTIGVYGSVTRMQGLGGSYYPAQDTEKLQQALGDILGKIMEAGIGEVQMSDGTTSNVTLSSSTESANLLKVDESSYKYYRAGGKDDDGKEKYDSTANNGLGVEWTNTDTPAPPAAGLNDKGAVVWNLPGVLENDVKYTVTFKCAPSQYTYDLIADLKNGVKKYEELDQNIREYLQKKDDGSYALLTNTEENTSFKYVDTRDENPEVKEGKPFAQQEPVATTAEQINIEKNWIGTYGTEQTSPSITMYILCDDEELDEQNKVTLNWNNNPENPKHTGSRYIATGQMTVDETAGTVNIFAPGHDYQLQEPQGLSYHWELQADVMHPMVVNGTLTMLVLVEDVPEGLDPGKDYQKIGDNKYYKIGDDYYTPHASSEALTATNSRRSDLNLTKAVTGDAAPEDAKFTFDMTLTAPTNAPADEEFWFSVVDAQNKFVKNLNVTGATAELGNTGYYHFESGKTVTVTLEDGWNLRFTNVLTGTKYKFNEETMPANFALNGIGVTCKDITSKEDKPIEDGTYTIGEDTAVINGTVVEGNASYTVTYTNDYQLTAAVIEKTFNGITSDKIPSDFSIKVTYGETKKTLKTIDSDVVKSDDGLKYTWTISELPVGTKVSATETPGTVSGYSLDPDTVLTGEVTTTTGSNEKISFTNTYTPASGTLTIQKIFAGITKDLIPANFAIKVTNDDNNYELKLTDEGVDKSDDGLTYTWKVDANIGTYTVEESGAEVENYTYTLAPDTTPITVNLTTDGANVTLTNTYTRDTGPLTITKVFEGIAKDLIPAASFKITVEGEGDTYTLKIQKADEADTSIIGTAAENGLSYTWTIANAKTGKYTVTEDENTAHVNGYKLDPDTEAKTEATVTKAGGEATLTNSYIPTDSGLKVDKVAQKPEGQSDESYEKYGAVYKEGDTITYKITVTNTGNTTLKISTLTDELKGVTLGALDKTTLAPGDTATATATYTVTPDDI